MFEPIRRPLQPRAGLLPADSRRAVVLVRTSGACHRDAAWRAAAFARILGVELVVLRLAVAPRPRANVLFPQRAASDALRRMRWEIRQRAVVSRWARCHEVRARAGGRPAPRIRAVATEEELAAVAAEEGAVLAVVPAGGWGGTAAIQFVRRLGAPVLVARRPPGSNRMVVASNLEDPSFPVLRQALPLARRLRARLTLVNNTQPLMPLEPMRWAPDESAIVALREAQIERLRAAMPGEIDFALTHQFDSAAGILEAAQAADADIIVVGIRRAGGCSLLFGARTPRRVIEQALRSVLVLPLP